MSRFLQLHQLTFYPSSNLNRDDIGRPKTAVIGGTTRLRVSSQSLKRAWRTSDVFDSALSPYLGKRTQRLGELILARLRAGGMDDKAALAGARSIAGVFGKTSDNQKDDVRTAQLVFISPQESNAAIALADRLLAGEEIVPQKDDILLQADSAVDLAMFGRMLAGAPKYNREAAVQVAHAFTTHAVAVEDDFFSSVDDKAPSEDAGAGFIGEAGFGSGVFYLYTCIDRELLERNLAGDTDLANAALAALVEAAATVSPTGKQNSFASRARAHYLLAESGDGQPRTLAGAFAESISGGDPISGSVRELRSWRDSLDRAYGAPAARIEMEVGGEGSLADVIEFCRS